MDKTTKINENFVIKTDMNKDDVKFYDAENKPFNVYGIFKENGRFRRIPEKIAETINVGVHKRHTNTSGGRVKFITDSSYVIINAEMDGIEKWPHFALTGYMGFDLYEDEIYMGTFVPSADSENGYENIIEFSTCRRRELTINFPLYSNVKKLYIGLQENAVIEEAPPYEGTQPIVYYGSSITQGGCASRPGMCYQAIVSREIKYDFVNLGFSGYALAEDELIKYIKKLDMSVFVYDYDHNAPTTAYLRDTHEKMFKAIRSENPTLPVIIMSRPKYNLTEEEKERRNIIENTYRNAIASGDKNVYFIDGQTLTNLCKDQGTVDNCHPNDYGFVSIAEALKKILKSIT